MQFIVCYDITENNIRLDIAALLIAKGFLRIQYSVFIGKASKSLLKEIVMQLEEIIQDATGSVYIFSQCKVCNERQQIIEPMAKQSKTKNEKKQQKTDPENKLKIPEKQNMIITPDNIQEYMSKKHPGIVSCILSKPKKRPKGMKKKETTILEIKSAVIIDDQCRTT